MTSSSTHTRDTAQLSPGVGGWGWSGREAILQPHSSSPSWELSLAQKGGMQEGPLLLSSCQDCGKWFFDHGLCLWSGSKSGFLSPGVWTFSLLLASSLGTKGTPESTHCLKLLSTPFLGAPQEDCHLNSVGQCPQDSARPCRLPTILISFILKSQDQSEKQMDCWRFPQGRCVSRKAGVGNPLAQFRLHYGRGGHETCVCHLPFELPAIQIQQMDLKAD